MRGPRGGIILSQEEHAKKLNSLIFPGIQGGPLMHVIAAKAAAFGEALKPEFRVYQEQVKLNASQMAETLVKRGLRIVSGKTESHVILVDLRAKNITGKAAEELLGKAHITVNKNAIPNDPEKPFVTSGIRIGSPAMTTRGFKEEESKTLANLIADSRCSWKRGSFRISKKIGWKAYGEISGLRKVIAFAIRPFGRA